MSFIRLYVKERCPRQELLRPIVLWKMKNHWLQNQSTIYINMPLKTLYFKKILNSFQNSVTFNVLEMVTIQYGQTLLT